MTADDLPIRTKIVATIGPASRSPAALRQLLEAGVNVFRLNFAHGTHEEHAAVLAEIRRLSRQLDQHVAVLQDLCGPKMRLGNIPGDLVDCQLGEEFTLLSDRLTDSPRELTCSYPDLPNNLKPGETVLFADGTVAMSVTEVPWPCPAAGDAPRQTAIAAGAEPARLGPESQVADRQGPAGPRLDRAPRG